MIRDNEYVTGSFFCKAGAHCEKIQGTQLTFVLVIVYVMDDVNHQLIASGLN